MVRNWEYLVGWVWGGVKAGVLWAVLVPGAALAEVDNEHLFGFTEGTDIGRKGDKELEVEAHGRFGKRSGSYSAVSPGVEGKFTVADHLRISPGVSAAHHTIKDAAGGVAHTGTEFESVSLETKFRVIDRAHNPFGMTVGFTPHWARLDSAGGDHVRHYGNALFLLVDRELVPNNVFSAFNVTYDIAASQSVATREWSHDSALGLSGGVAARAHGQIFLGAEARYVRVYDGLGLDRFSGHALFVGPTFYTKLSETVWMAAAWNIQVAGRANGVPAYLDLENFENHEVAVRIGIAF
jgi:hypothetical protein